MSSVEARKRKMTGALINRNYSGSEGQRHIGTTIARCHGFVVAMLQDSKCFASLLRYFFLCAFAPVPLCACLSSYDQSVVTTQVQRGKGTEAQL